MADRVLICYRILTPIFFELIFGTGVSWMNRFFVFLLPVIIFFKKINQIKFDFKLFFVQPKNSILTDYL